MGDDDQRRAEALGQILHQFEDLRLDGDVERRRRLVGDNQLRLAAQRHGDHHPLAHAARQVMGVLVEPSFRVGNADHFQELQRLLGRFLVGNREMGDQGFRQLFADRQDRIERRHRLLEHHRDVLAAKVAHGFFVQGQKVLAVEIDAALDDLSRRPRNEAQDRKRADRFAAAGFPDYGHGFAFVDAIGDAVDRFHGAGGGEKLSLQVLNSEKCRHDPPCMGCY